METLKVENLTKIYHKIKGIRKLILIPLYDANLYFPLFFLKNFLLFNNLSDSDRLKLLAGDLKLACACGNIRRAL